jgi:hypothetical protein
MSEALLAVFTGILALAVLMQSVVLFLAFRHFRKLAENVLPGVKKVAEQAETALEKVSEIADTVKPAAQKLAASATAVHDRVVEIDGFLGEVVENSRREIVAIQETIHVVTERTQEAVNALSDNVLMPITRVNALTQALKVAASVFFRRRKAASSPDTPPGPSSDGAYF